MSDPRLSDALLLVALVLALTVGAFGGALDTWFTDADALADVAWAARPWSDQLLVPLTGGLGGENANFWRPAAMLQYALLYRLFGLDPRGWHAWDLGLHVAATLLATGWWVASLRHARRPHRGLALTFAVGFVVHPLAVEVVPAVARNLDLLLAVGWFGASWAFVAAQTARRERRPAGLLAGLAAVGGLVALGSKEAAVLLVPLGALWIALFRDDLPLRGRAVEAARVLGPTVPVLLAWAVVRARVLGGLGGYHAEEEARVGARLAYALARGFLEPLVPSLSPHLGAWPGAAGLTALALGWAVVLAWLARSGDRRLVAFCVAGWAAWVVLLGVNGVYTRRVLYVPTALVVGVVAVGLAEVGRRRSVPGAVVAAVPLGAFLHGTPARAPDRDWALAGELARQVAEAPAWETVPAGETVWLVDRPYRVDRDPRRFRLWSHSRSLTHPTTLYSLEAWRALRGRPVRIASLSRWFVDAGTTPARVTVAGDTLTVHRIGGHRALSTPPGFTLTEDGDRLTVRAEAPAWVMVWNEPWPRVWRLAAD